MAERPKNTMTKPFVFNDAIVVKRWVNPNLLPKPIVDSLSVEVMEIDEVMDME